MQVFASVLYGQPGGQLRFQVTPAELKAYASLVGTAQALQALPPGKMLTEADIEAQARPIRDQFENLQYAPILQAGVVLRLSI